MDGVCSDVPPAHMQWLSHHRWLEIRSRQVSREWDWNKPTDDEINKANKDDLWGTPQRKILCLVSYVEVKELSESQTLWDFNSSLSVTVKNYKINVYIFFKYLIYFTWDFSKLYLIFLCLFFKTKHIKLGLGQNNKNTLFHPRLRVQNKK